MSEFWSALWDPELAFLRYTLFVSLLASCSFGVMGTYVVVHRISAIAGAIAHCVLAGIGAALYMQRVWGWSWLDPILGAVVAALAAAGLLGTVSLRLKEREDTVIGALWAIGMAIGLLFLARTPGYADPMSYLFGNILIISSRELILIAFLDIIVLGFVAWNYRRFQALCFDPEFSMLRGMQVHFYYLLLLGLIALTIVLLIHVVGIVLVIALLTIPSAIAARLVRHLWQMMIISGALCATFLTVGLGFSFEHDLPTGPTAVIIAAGAYLLVFAIQRFWKVRKRAG